MSVKTNTHNRFRTDVIREKPDRVDRENNIIYGAKLMQKGPLRDGDSREWIVDDKTLLQVMDFGSRYNKGAKARFTHPSLSSDGLGSYVGRWQSLRREGDAVVGDLHIADVAFESPKGDLGSYILDLAEQDPDAFGISAAGLMADEMFDSDENPADEETGKRPIRFRGIHAFDVVDTPAATSGLFSIDSQDGIPAAAAAILDTYFADSDPQDVLGRFRSFLERHYECDLSSNSKEDLSHESDDPETPEHKVDERMEGKKFLEAFGEKGAVWFVEGKTFEECQALHQQEIIDENSALKSEVESLKQQLTAALNAAGEAGDIEFSEETEKPDPIAERRQKLLDRNAPKSIATLGAILGGKKGNAK